MSEVIIRFYSDTNYRGAWDELALLQVDMAKADSAILMDTEEFFALEEPIRNIVEYYGGQFAY